jgi:hypothetical protein
MVHYIYMYYYGMKIPQIQMNSSVQELKDDKKIQNGLLEYFDNIINQNIFKWMNIWINKIFDIYPCTTRPPNVNRVKVLLGYQKGPSPFVSNGPLHLKHVVII